MPRLFRVMAHLGMVGAVGGLEDAQGPLVQLHGQGVRVQVLASDG
jgi:hypothetical protein